MCLVLDWASSPVRSFLSSFPSSHQAAQPVVPSSNFNPNAPAAAADRFLHPGTFVFVRSTPASSFDGATTSFVFVILHATGDFRSSDPYVVIRLGKQDSDFSDGVAGIPLLPPSSSPLASPPAPPSSSPVASPRSAPTAGEPVPSIAGTPTRSPSAMLL